MFVKHMVTVPGVDKLRVYIVNQEEQHGNINLVVNFCSY